MGRKVKDLTGQKFGKLVVIERVEKPDNINDKKAYWICKCECGNITKPIAGTSLTRGNTQSCGCLQKTTVRKVGTTTLKDLTGQSFGNWTVIERAENRGRRVCWLCQCTCGNIKVIQAHNLKRQLTNECQCPEQLIGKKFSCWTVVERVEKPSHIQGKGAFYLCKCECGNERIISGRALRANNFSDCECTKDLTGQKFGDWKVIGKVDTHKHGRTYWLCECECGKISEVSQGNLTQGLTTGCGCKKSKKMKQKWENEEYRNSRSGSKSCKWKGGITPISNHLRSLNLEWYDDCKKQANYTCQLTGKTGVPLNTHHLKAFNVIVLEAHELHNIQIKEIVGDYTEEELKLLEEYVASWHKDNSNAVVLCEDVHKLFHTSEKNGGYGQGDNTPEQFEEFKERYLAGEFDDILK